MSDAARPIAARTVAARTVAATAVLAAVLALAASGGVADDLHVLWDRQCGGCHGHAGAFARATLHLDDGVLRDRAGREVARFLDRHNGGYSPDRIAAIIGMLRAQAVSSDLFQRKCGECHGTAAELVRDRLLRRDGTLVVRANGRPLDEVLRRHGDVDAGQAAALSAVLDRVETEVRHR